MVLAEREGRMKGQLSCLFEMGRTRYQDSLMRASVSLSTLEVASSIRITLLLLKTGGIEEREKDVSERVERRSSDATRTREEARRTNSLEPCR